MSTTHTHNDDHSFGLAKWICGNYDDDGDDPACIIRCRFKRQRAVQPALKVAYIRHDEFTVFACAQHSNNTTKNCKLKCNFISYVTDMYL